VTDIQERQMTSILSDNVHCISIDGDFDAAQLLVKDSFADPVFREEVKLGTFLCIYMYIRRLINRVRCIFMLF
jgi:threonine synthase